MNIPSVISNIESNYNIKVNTIEKIKNVYKVIDDNDEIYCLKVIKYKFKHFKFIVGCINHLRDNGFDKVPKIISTINKKSYIKLENYYCYLTKWFVSRECNYDNPIDLENATKNLALLHNKSQGFILQKDMEPRIGWFKWINTFNTRQEEIIDFKGRINKKSKKSEFDYIYLEIMEQEINRAKKSVDNLISSKYMDKMIDEIDLRGFCHHDYAHHNVLINEENQFNIIDFDYCILDSSLHDLSSLIIRVMKNGKWDMHTVKNILNAYSSVREIKKIDIPIMASFIEFPQDYWQVGIQYYWEKQPWSENFFINKINKIKEDREIKQEFVEEFMVLNF